MYIPWVQDSEKYGRHDLDSEQKWGGTISRPVIRTVSGTTRMHRIVPLTKYSRPDICNPVRELSKTMDAPAPVHLKEMYKVIRHVLSTKGYGLKFELRKDMIKWALKALSDSDFASDKERRINVFGYIIYFCGIPIAWRSKGMKNVVLSTTEAEYICVKFHLSWLWCWFDKVDFVLLFFITSFFTLTHQFFLFLFISIWIDPQLCMSLLPSILESSGWFVVVING